MQDLVRPIKSDDFYASEAKELHEMLDSLGIPWKTYESDGLLSDENGSYYLIPLIDRVMDYKNASK